MRSRSGRGLVSRARVQGQVSDSRRTEQLALAVNALDVDDLASLGADDDYAHPAEVVVDVAGVQKRRRVEVVLLDVVE